MGKHNRFPVAFGCLLSVFWKLRSFIFFSFRSEDTSKEAGPSDNPRKRRAADSNSDTDILAEGGKGEAAKKKAKGGE